MQMTRVGTAAGVMQGHGKVVAVVLCPVPSRHPNEGLGTRRF